MQISVYTRKIIIICTGLSAVIIGLSFVLFNQGPRVRFVQGVDEIQSSALTANSNLQIVFDRPIEQRDYHEYIVITPKVDFTTQTNTQSITLTIQDNLRSSTDYTVSVMPEIFDRSGKKMKNIYEYSFMTAQPSYAYLERNYGINKDTDASFLDINTDADDHIKISALGSESEVVFSHPQILSFAANKQYVVVAVKEEDNDDLYTIDLNTEEIRKEKLWSRGRINNLTLSPRSKTALLTTLPDYSSVSPEYYEEFADRIESIDLVDGTTISLTDMNGDPLQATSIHTDVDGQIALIRDREQTYYAVSPFNDFTPVPIGSFSDSFGFSQDGTEIIFRDASDIVRYDIDSASTTLIEPIGNVYVIDIESRNSTVNYSSVVYSTDSSYSRVERLTDWNSKASTIWSSSLGDTSRFREFSTSYDDMLISLQFNPKDCQFDDYGVSSECKDVFQQIINIENDNVLDRFRGFNLTWLP